MVSQVREERSGNETAGKHYLPQDNSAGGQLSLWSLEITISENLYVMSPRPLHHKNVGSVKIPQNEDFNLMPLDTKRNIFKMVFIVVI